MNEVMPAILLTKMNVATEDDEEFNRWYSGEHMPDLLACPGFRYGYRLSAAPVVIGPASQHPRDGHRYINIYVLDSAEALTTPEYNEIAFVNPTPWTRSMRTKLLDVERDLYLGMPPPARLNEPIERRTP